MSEEKDETARNAMRVCSNEGCGCPAEGALCENCALEWGLFHREARAALDRDGGSPLPGTR